MVPDDIATRKSRLSETKRLLLEKLLEDQATDTELQTVPRRSLRDSAPLSFAQRRLWFINQLHPAGCAYNIPFALRLRGCLDVPALELALNEIIRRHESLRTTFAVVNGDVSQRIAPVSRLSLLVEDLSSLPAVECDKKARHRIHEEARQPFDLSQGPLLRVNLLRLSRNEHIALMMMHHIISDGWSIDVFERELTTLYEAYVNRQPSPLDELKIQYGDYASWQHEWLCGERLEAELSYWKEQLDEAPRVLELSVTRPRPAVQTLTGRTESFELQTEVSRKLRQLCQQEGVTLFMLLLAAFKVLLYRYTGQRDLVVGTPIAGRNREELEGLIGYFVNTLALRTKLTDSMTFQELLMQVRETTLDAYAHQDLPFEKVVEEIHPERNLSHAPLVQVMFGLSLRQKQQEYAQIAGLTWSKVEIESITAKFDLALEMSDCGETIGGSLEYSTDLIEQATIRRLAVHFQTLLGSIVSNPSERISRLQLLTETERRRLLREWSETGAPLSAPHHHFQQLFEKQATQTPRAKALEFAGEGMSYGDLNRRANQLAHYLRASGVRPDTLVAVLLERSVEMVVALIAVLKAGGAYVPLDPSYPRERLAFMLEDAKAKVLLTQSRLTSLLPEISATVIYLDLCHEVVKHESEENPDPVADGDNLAYVIYTSGTTGRPKGVMVTHRGLSNSAAAQFEIFHIPSEHRILQFASLGFDASIFEITLALCTGAALCVWERETLLGPELVQLLRDRVIMTAILPPSVLAVLPSEQLTELRTIIVGGEACSAALVAQWATGGRRFFNAYGPTEATVWAAVAECSEGRRNPPIGRPIPGAQIYLLDPRLQPVPVGMPGELFIGGEGIARGYLGRPDLTADKFIPHPFANQPGARLYRTGDRGRYLPDGQIEFLGRLDRQVKLRGFRIELGEIEAVLRQHPAVQHLFMVAHEDMPGRGRLIAYVVPKPATVCQVTELHSFLSNRLPGHMVPSLFVLLEALPLNPHGKVDQRQLPAPETVKTERREYTAPRTAVEKILSRIWAEVLNVERVSIHDNFFGLGGDSILSLQLITQARRAGLELAPRQLFQYQAIAELANVATTRQPVSAQQGLVTGAVSLTPIQHWFFAQHLTDMHHFNLAVMLEAQQTLDAKVLATAVAHLLDHHDALRLRFEYVEGKWQQFSSAEEECVLTRLDLSESTEEAQTKAMEAAASELQRSLDLSKGPLVRMALFELGAGKANRLLWVIHHLVVDWVSWRILLEDLATAYGQLINKEEVKLPSKTTSFKEWADKLAQYAATEELASEADYWLVQALQPSKTLPVDHRTGDNTVASARIVSVSLSKEQTRTLLQDVSSAHGVQVNETLLAALARACLRWTAESRLLLDVDGHGREDIVEGVDLSRTVGWFSALYPVLLEWDPDDDMEAVLRSVKVKLRSVPNRGIGYGLLRYMSYHAEITPAWKAARQAEICFTYLGQFDQALNSASLFALARESPGPFRSERGLRSYLLDIVGSVVGGQLLVDWIYSENLHRRATIELLAHEFIENLITLSSKL